MHAVQMRAASLGMSALLLGGALLAALSMKYVVETFPLSDSPVPISEVLKPPAAPPPPAVRPPAPPPQQTSTEPTALAPPPLDLGPIEAGPSAGPWVAQVYTVNNPHWLRRPADLERYYPRRALDMGVEGVVVLNCQVTTAGRLNCTVASETPERWGFGAAALRIAADHQMEPARRDGAAVEARYQMRIPFNMD